MKFSALFILSIAFYAFTFFSNAYASITYASPAEIVGELPAKEVKTFTRQITIRTTCDVDPLGDDHDQRQYGPECTCVFAMHQAEAKIREAYPSATKIEGFTNGYRTQPRNECGVKLFDATGTVTYTVTQ